MATEKYFLHVRSVTLGMRYNFDNFEFVIGGYANCKSSMETILTDYFNIDIPEPRFTQKNKMQYIIRMEPEIYKTGFEMLEEHSFVMEKTTNHERLMR